MTIRFKPIFVLLTVILLTGILGLADAKASGGLKAVSFNKTTVDHGDPPHGGGGVDGVRHPNSTSTPSTSGRSVRSRASVQSRDSSSARPQP